MAVTSPRDAVAAAAAVISAVDARLDEVTRSTQELLVAEISDLRGDAQLLPLLRDTVASNVETFFSTVRHNIPIEQVEPPTAALEYARRLAQRDVSANALVRAYRLGHQAVLRAILDELRVAELEPKLGLEVYELLVATSFGYIDWISQRVVATYQNERERWVENRNSLRSLLVRELLADAAVDVDAMTTAIRYPIRCTHLALVLWCPESGHGDELASMERFVHQLAEAVGAGAELLFIPADQVTGWAWIPVPAEAAPTAVERVRAVTEAESDAPWVAIGRPLPDLAGFRRSHRQARDARTVATISGAPRRRVTAAGDEGLAVATLLGDNMGVTAAWVGEVLGPLGSDTANDHRLRETLRVFLGAGSSYTGAAAELHLHPNSVKYRVGRAVGRRGRAITADRLDVEVALTLCHWFGIAVLS